MELLAEHLFDEQRHVVMHLALAPSIQKQLLAEARRYWLALGIDGLECELCRVSGRGPFQLLANKALVASVALGDGLAQAVLTVSAFRAHTVVGLYQHFLGNAAYPPQQSSEVRRRAVFAELGSVALADEFALVEQAAVHVWQGVCEQVDELATAAASAPAVEA